MDTLKKAGIIGGAIVGGIVGGALSVAGHVSKNKFIDELGDSVVDSTILTGSIAGQLASGTADIISGKLKKEPLSVHRGKADLRKGGGRVVGNYVNNFKLIVRNSGDIVDGVKKRDIKKVLNGAKTLGKIATIGAITVGAIKIKESDDDIDK
ncbi:MAG TPA: hypothetical protein VFC96_04285 [Anaerovoracaceae bacterium]|nr:hypothetical protein [Anaerovoracaceae bacterium]